MTDLTQPARPGLLRRIATFPLVTMILECVAITAAALITSKTFDLLVDTERNTLLRTLNVVAIVLAVVLAYKACQRWLEKRADGEMPLAPALREMGLGLLAGFLLFSAVVGAVALLGGFEVLGLRGWGQIWTMVAMALYSGVFEEVLFRGVILRHLERMTGTWIALALTSAFFGFGHLGNPDATWFAGLAISIEAGILLGASYLLTRRLWVPIGIHAAWNFTQGWVYSIPVSGGEAPLGLLVTRRAGPDWLTGAGFGLEASVVALVIATAAGLVFLYAAVKRGQIVPPMSASQTKL